MSAVINRVSDFLRPGYVRWPLLAILLIGLPWIVPAILPFLYEPNNYTYSQLTLWVTLAVVAVGLNLLTGLTGMISLGHSAIYAAGAFSAAYFTGRVGLPYPVSIVLAAIFAGLIGLIIGLPSLRLSGPYLAVATFGFAIAVPQMLASSKELGSLFADQNDVTAQIGVFKVPKQIFLTCDAGTTGFCIPRQNADLGRYYLFLIIAAIMVALAVGIWRSRTGRAFRAIRDSETAAQAMGVNIARYKVLAFVISAMYAGVAGSMYSAQVGQLEANDLQFSAVESVLFLTAIILGGLGSISGAIVGSAALTLLPAFTSRLRQFIDEQFNYKIENFESIFYGLIIILCIFFMPNGIVGAWRSLIARLRRDRKGEALLAARGPLTAVASADGAGEVADEIAPEVRKGV